MEVTLKKVDTHEADTTEENGKDYKAVHIKGGDLYSNQLIDIQKSHETIKNIAIRKRSIRRPYFLNIISFAFNAALQKFKWHEFFLVTGLKRKWFDDFTSYWRDVLQGRPITVTDYMMLLHDYRKKQLNKVLEWNTPAQHIQNWQEPYGLYFTFSLYRKHALTPIVGLSLWNKLHKNDLILEYGCALAPYYNCYRNFFSHLDCEWTLADIPNFPFHFAKYLYGSDEKLHLQTIQADMFHDPLKSEKLYDVIILTTVLEHLDDPVFITDYLLQRLKKGGLFVFDYVISEGIGFDTPRSLTLRTECLKMILDRVEIVHGAIDISDNVALVIAKRK